MRNKRLFSTSNLTSLKYVWKGQRYAINWVLTERTIMKWWEISLGNFSFFPLSISVIKDWFMKEKKCSLKTYLMLYYYSLMGSNCDDPPRNGAKRNRPCLITPSSRVQLYSWKTQRHTLWYYTASQARCRESDFSTRITSIVRDYPSVHKLWICLCFSEQWISDFKLKQTLLWSFIF